jgi:hypothetical protein
VDHDGLFIEAKVDGLIHNEDDSRRIAANLVLRDIKIPHDRHILKIRSHLVQSMALGLLGGHSDPVLFRVSVAQAIFPLTSERTDFR